MFGRKFVTLRAVMINPDLYSLNFTPLVWCFIGAMVLFMALIGIVLWPKLRRVRRRVDEDNEAPLPAEGYPAVSVIVYAQSAGHNLRTLLPQILQQDYPSAMEVIVVNDETDDDTENIVSELELYYPNLYMTFAPERSRSLSRRKLAITLGIKAARYDVVMLTDGFCRLTSPLWLRSMMRHVVSGADVVLGYAEIRESEGSKPIARRYSFDRLWESVRWLSSAICGRPVRGSSYNLAYRRNLFFDHKGFSQTLHLKYGDDDVFINEIANRYNTAVELSDASRVVVVEPKPDEMAPIERMRREYTASMLPRCSYVSMALTSLCWWLWAGCGIAATALALPSLIPGAAAFVLAVTFSFIAMTQWRRTAVALGERPLFWTVPWMAWARPIRTFFIRIRGRRSRRDNLTHVI